VTPQQFIFSIIKTVEEGNDEDFDEMMEHLLDRDGPGQEQPILAEVIDHSLEHSAYDVDETQHDSQVCLPR